MLYALDWVYIKKLIQSYNLFNIKIWRGGKLSKKKYLLLLIPVILIAVFIVVNYKPLSLAVEYYNETNVYSLENNAASLNYLIQKVESDVAGNNYKQYMLDITDYYITSDFVYVIFDKLGIVESYYNGILSKLVEQTLFISVIKNNVKPAENQKISEMLKYYSINDMENFPELTLAFIKQLSHYITANQLYTISLVSTTLSTNSICYVAVTANGCNKQDYYFNKYIYNPFQQVFDYYFSVISAHNEKIDLLKQQHAESSKLFICGYACILFFYITDEVMKG